MRWFLGVTLILLVALILESGLLAYAMYVLLIMMAVSRLLARAWTGNLSATRKSNRLVAEVGQKIRVEITVHNSGRLPVPWVLLEDMLPRYALERPPRLKIIGKRIQARMMRAGAEIKLKYELHCKARGYFQLGPLVMETGDLFGLHRRYHVGAEPEFLLVYPKVIPLEGYDIASRRPIGDIRLAHRQYEDPTRIAGVRRYEPGDPLNRVHWRATARTGTLQSKMYDPSTVAGATLILDFHADGYHRQGEPFRSELAVTTAVSLAHSVYEMGQQVGFITNARDAADRIRLEGWVHDFRTRQAARRQVSMRPKSERLHPLILPTQRGAERFQQIRETMARIELTDGMTTSELIVEATPRLPRDATVVALLPRVTAEAALALGNLRRQGYAVSVVLIALEDGHLQDATRMLLGNGIMDIRPLTDESGIPSLCQQQVLLVTPYQMEVASSSSQ
jgi:uncharacterized repeat protein (TIGR01451 family)